MLERGQSGKGEVGGRSERGEGETGRRGEGGGDRGHMETGRWGGEECRDAEAVRVVEGAKGISGRVEGGEAERRRDAETPKWREL